MARVPLKDFRAGELSGAKVTQEAVGTMFNVSQGTISTYEKDTESGKRRYSVQRLPKRNGDRHYMYALIEEETKAVGVLPWV